MTTLRKSGNAVVAAESKTAAERTESPAATTRTSRAPAARQNMSPVVNKAASPATAAPVGIVAESASDSHTHAASATAAKPPGNTQCQTAVSDLFLLHVAVDHCQQL